MELNNYKADLLIDIIKWVLEYDCDETELRKNILLILDAESEKQIEDDLLPFYELMRSKGV
jgi:hypothetical protein